MLLAEIVETSQRISDAHARLAKVAALADLLRRLPPEETGLAVAYLSGVMRQGRVGLGPAALHGAFPDTSAHASTVTIGEVDETLERIASTAGPGSARARGKLLHDLLARGTRDEQDFLARLILGELRQGALEGIMAEAIARAADVPPALVRRALMLSGDVSEAAQAALSSGRTGLERFSIKLFRPVQPMLAHTADAIEDVFDRFTTAALEYKLDGARVQVHRSGGDVRVYTRRLNDVTEAVPELVEQVLKLPANEIILDGETLSLRTDGRPQPFQVTMRRFGRRLDVTRLREQLPLSTYFFDILYMDGESLIDRPTDDRLAAMTQALPDELQVPRAITNDPDEAERFLESALAVGHEGVMAKALDALYEAGRRGRTWLKLKPAHTLDLVVLAAEWGSGRRRGWLSNLHLGARDPVTGSFVMLGKTFKGMTDEILEWQTKRLQELEVARDEWTVYVEPKLVVEIAFNNVQESPHYPGGLALRFARLRRYRPDKRPEDADTIEAVRVIYQRGHARADS